MKTIAEKLYKKISTRVFVRFGLDLQQVILKIEDWDQELKDLWIAHVDADNSGSYELLIKHGIECSCCTKIITESYTRPTLAETKREKRPGRPRTKGVNGFILGGMR